MALRGDRLRTAREAKGYTPVTLARIIHVEPQQITRWEHTPSNPGASFVLALADALEVSTDYLLGRDTQPLPIRESDLTPAEQRLIQAYRAGKLLELFEKYLGHVRPAPAPTSAHPTDGALVKRQDAHRRPPIKQPMAIDEPGPRLYQYECTRCKATLIGVASNDARCPSCGSSMRVVLEIERQ
ncbi:MAG: helix-turn-helix domain-containing protein [Anaerolineae bacterium]|nr:helix-turn-helix domain-containing protein [Anaerolineae bacterium]